MGGNGEQFFHPAQYQMRLDESLRGLVSEMKSTVQLFATPFAGKKPDNIPAIRLGAFASGAAVLQSRAAVDRIVGHHKDLKAIDMEVYSVMYALRVSEDREHGFQTIVSTFSGVPDASADNSNELGISHSTQ